MNVVAMKVLSSVQIAPPVKVCDYDQLDTVELESNYDISTTIAQSYGILYTLTADIDECNMTCFESENRTCNNTIGSYECSCMDGYQENELSQICEGWCTMQLV